MNHWRKLQCSKMRGSSSFDEKSVDYFQYQFLKAYLHKVFVDRTKGSSIQVIRLLARDYDFKLRPVTVRDVDGGGDLLISDDSIDATVIYGDDSYEVMVIRYKEAFGDDMRYIVAALGLSGDAKKPAALIEALLHQSMLVSPYRNQCLSVRPIERRNSVSLEISAADLEDTSLGDIFLPESIKKYLGLFVDCVHRYEELRQPLRYLLSGKPGTAKTKIIRAIANEAKGDATFIFTNGSDCVVDQVFDLANHFSPAVICIDDVDLLVGSRQNESERSDLANFLQKLDGFVSSAIFILATTNNKQLVDTAASRPGRFDMILDIDVIDRTHYVQLVRSKTTSKQIIELFNDPVVELLHARKATGAFVAALVKQIQIRLNLGQAVFGGDDVIETIELMNRGFYKAPENRAEKPGFQLS